MPTPHIDATKDDIAPLVLMPGDPSRAKKLAKKYLSECKLINDVREEYGYTGFYKGVKVTIFSSGMGIPSMGIYSYELFNEYDVKAIIRIGSAGSYVKELNIYDVLLVNKSYTRSGYVKEYGKINPSIVSSSSSSKKLNDIIFQTAKEKNTDLVFGNVHTTESFYGKSPFIFYLKNIKKCLAVEMESYSLFYNAKISNKLASCLLTISDSFVTKQKISSEERENNFNKMIELALDSIIKVK